MAQDTRVRKIINLKNKVLERVIDDSSHITVKYNWLKIPCIIDSGATNSFLLKYTAQKLKLQFHSFTGMCGTASGESKISSYVQASIKNKKFETVVKAYVIKDLVGDRLVLGYRTYLENNIGFLTGAK